MMGRIGFRRKLDRRPAQASPVESSVHPDTASGIECNRRGFDFIAWSGDAWALGDAVAAALAETRAGRR